MRNMKGHEVKLLSSGYTRIQGTKCWDIWQGKWPPEDRRAFDFGFYPDVSFEFKYELDEVYEIEVEGRFV